MVKIAILTNARAADQRSMIGYGEILLEVARQTGAQVVEWRGASFFAKLPVSGAWRKLALNLDRFIITPLKLIGRSADLVQVVDPGNCIYLPFTRHRRSIVTVHDMIPYLARDGKLSGWRPTRTGQWLMNSIVDQLARVDHIISVSHATKRDVLSYVNIAENRVTVIHNAVFQPMAPAASQACFAFRKKYGLPQRGKLILHIGSNWYKNRETVLEVTAKVRHLQPEVHLVMVGALTPSLQSQAVRLSLSNALHVLERVARDDMSALYTTASALIFPSIYEGFGLPVLEAQMCGTPVVCSDAGSLPEVAGDATLMADCIDTTQLSQQILHFLREGKGEVKMEKLIFDPIFSLPVWKNKYLKLFECHLMCSGHVAGGPQEE
jgi:glycosyltransferase involved in cell wall biosynthesis